MMARLILFLAASIVACPLLLAQQSDPALKKLQEMTGRAREEGNQFREAGGKPGAPNDTARKWATAFWELREKHPGTEVARRGTYLAIAWLMFAHNFDGVIAKAENLSADDPAWERVARYFAAASASTSRTPDFVKKATSLAHQSKDKRVRAALRNELGRAHLSMNRPEEARAVFQAVVDDLPGSDLAKMAAANIAEISRLDVGKAAPEFNSRALDDSLISSRQLRGKVVLLNFWATW